MKRFTSLVNEPNTNIENLNENKKYNFEKVRFLISKILNDNINVVVDGGVEPYGFNHLKLSGVDEVSELLSELVKEMIDGQNDVLTILEGITHKSNINDKDKVRLLFRKYKKHNDIISKAKSQADKMKSGEVAYGRAIAAKQLKGIKEFDKKTLDDIHNIFLFRSKQLGYNNFL